MSMPLLCVVRTGRSGSISRGAKLKPLCPDPPEQRQLNIQFDMRMRTCFRGVFTILALLLTHGISRAQWVAFNDHAPGPLTGPYTSFWNVENQPPGRIGLLTNAIAGALPQG